MKKLEGKPFALIGVNGNNYQAKKLKEVMVKQRLDWRSFADPGTIGARWNKPGTPTYYVIDDKGVIRHKWVGYPGEKAIDTTLESLVGAVEGNAKTAPRTGH